MCGIAGIVGRKDASCDTLARMCDALAHRGPDDADLCVWEEQGVALGHRRLSIIDLSPAGRNPMANEDGTVWVVHNGEIYNYRELRTELESAGHRFRSTSDTEVIVHAYEEWGEDHVRRLRGMFAYAVYDRRAEGRGSASTPRLLLVRDRLGIKPLFYSWDGRRLLFASEPKAILAVPGFDRTPDRSALFDYLTCLYVPAPKTAWEGMRKLGPGQMLRFDGTGIECATYWDLRPATNGDVSEDEALALVRGRLRDAVGTHLVADVPVGLFLSGGVDSSTVGALMAGAAEGAVRAYSIGFDVAGHDERAFARLVAARYGMEHRERVVEVGAVREVLPRIAAMYDEPFADGSAVPTLRVSEVAREDVKVVLSGDGGDEVFGGYGRYRSFLRRDRVGFLPPWARRAVFGSLAGLPGFRRHRFFEDVTVEPLRQYGRLLELFSPAEKRGALGADFVEEFRDYDDDWYLRPHWREDLDPITRMQVVDVKTYLPDDILTKVDRASMSAGLEVRPPLLDHELVEAVFSLPASVRVLRGGPKGLLKGVARELIPKEIVERSKKGFSAPWNAWMAELDGWAPGYLRNGAAVQAEILAPDALGHLRADKRGAQTWALLLLEEWCRTNL